MPNHDAAIAKLIAENLHKLPGQDAKHRRLLAFNTIGHSPEHAEKITRAALDTGQRIVHLLKNAGYTFTHPSDPEPTENLGPYLVATAYCGHCADPIHTLTNLKPDPNRPDHFTAQLYRQGIEAIGHNHRCWE
ncbi:hypothetical protein [Mycobacterium avium]|uniref:hypothetical protein n=1 Tax=Mycobacterium avium TaxID=1764 RepID=UPI000CE3C5ED|nr:hypothetical protein [Mycobacterium avium]